MLFESFFFLTSLAVSMTSSLSQYLVFAQFQGSLALMLYRSVTTESTDDFILLSASQPDISPEVRRKLGEAAVRAAKAVNYVGAGEDDSRSSPTLSTEQIKHSFDVLMALCRHCGVHNGRPA